MYHTKDKNKNEIMTVAIQFYNDLYSAKITKIGIHVGRAICLEWWNFKNYNKAEEKQKS